MPTYYLQSTNAYTNCDLPVGFTFDLNTSVGSSTAGLSGSGSASYVEIGSFDAYVTGITTATWDTSIDIATISGSTQVRYRIQQVDPISCSVVNSSSYSTDYTTTGIKTNSMALTWAGSDGILRLSIEMMRNGGSTTPPRILDITCDADSFLSFTPVDMRMKTVCYAWPMSSVPDSTPTALGSKTIYIPETSRTFKSAYLEVSFQDTITATGGTVSQQDVTVTLGAASPSAQSETSDITQSGENISGYTGPWDFTSYFTSDFGSGASQTCDISLQFIQSTGTTLGMVSCTAMLYITYEYNYAIETTQIKTVMIPMESPAGALPTTETELGTNQIPQLTGTGGFLPEDSVVIRDYFFVIEANTAANNNATDWTLTGRIDSEGGGGTSIATIEGALASDAFARWIWSRTSTYPTTTSAHAFKLWAASIARANMCCVTLYVTYEFDADATTKVMNSILFPIDFSSPLGGNTSTEASRYTRNFFIEEPGTITLKQSVFRIHFSTTASIAGLEFRAGSQSYRAYTHTASVVAGMFCLQQRIDSGSAQGAGISVARGKNTIVVDGFRTDTTDDPTNVCGYIILNYESDKHVDGIGAHNKTIFWAMNAWEATLTDRVQFDFSLPIPENYYYLTAVGFYAVQWSALAANAITFDAQCLSSEGKGLGYYSIYSDAQQSDSERSIFILWGTARDVFRLYPTDPDSDKVDLETTRMFRFYNPGVNAQGAVFVITYHTITYNIGGAIVGYSGDGSGIVVNIHRSDNDVKVGTATTAAGGSYSFVWYDDVVNVYCHAQQAEGYVGRSENGTAG